MTYPPNQAGLNQARQELTGRLVSCCLPLTCCDIQAEVVSLRLGNGEIVARLRIEGVEYEASVKDLTI